MKNPQENLIHDTTTSEKAGKGFGVEMTSGEAKKITGELARINDLINHDSLITQTDLSNLDTMLKELKVDIDGECMSVKGVESIIENSENGQIWKDIIKGSLDSIRSMGGNKIHSLLIPSLIQKRINRLVWQKFKEGEVGDIILQRLVTEIPSDVAEYFKQIPNQGIELYKLTTLSDKLAECLSEHRFYVEFGKISKLSDYAAECLSKIRGGVMFWDELKNISDEAAKYFGNHRGYLGLGGLTSLSDKSAEYLSHHIKTENSGINLSGLVQISDETAKFLGQCTDEIKVSDEIRSQINKFKK